MSYGNDMDDNAGSGELGGEQRRVLQHLDRMVSAGRVTAEEAERLRGAGDVAAFDAALAEIRTGHAGPDLDAAVADGQLTQPEADELLDRLRRGEHSPGLHKRVRPWRNLHRRSPGDSPAPQG
jgi:polyhydroxyalkanoate synthesis regulator phasin